jgi:hypothetical protein
VGKAFSFDGASRVLIPDGPIWTETMGDTSSFTVEMWVQFSALQAGNVFMGHDEDPGPRHLKWVFWQTTQVAQNGGSQGLLFHVFNETNAPGRDVVAAEWNPVVDQWYHVAVTREGSTFRLYIDGHLAQTSTDTTSIPDPDFALTLGSAESMRFSGLIDEVTMYNRALDHPEILAVYASGSGGKCAPGCTPPSITDDGQPHSTSALVGEDVTFSVTASGTALHYQWRKNGVALPNATDQRLTISSLAQSDAGDYDVVVTAGCGASVTSSRATLEVATIATTTTVSASRNPSVYGDPVALIASIKRTSDQSAVPPGWVVFKEGSCADGSQLGVALSSDGTARLDGINLPAAGSPHTISACFQGGASYAASEGGLPGGQSVQKAEPAFSGLSSPTITYGTGTTVLSGKLSAGPLVPTGNVAVTLAGVTQNAHLDAADGSFAMTFATASLPATPGSHGIVFRYPGDENFNAPPNGSSTLTVTKAPQQIDFAALPSRTYGDAPFVVSAEASSGLPVSLALDAASTGCTLAPATRTVTITGATVAGQFCIIAASQEGDGNYEPAGAVAQRFSIAKATQTIAFPPLADRVLGDPAVPLTAAASSGLTVTFSLGAGSMGCSLDPTGTKVTLSDATTACTIAATQGGNQNYNAAPTVRQILRVLYRYAGFFQPVDNPEVVNSAKAGSAIPVKFSLNGDRTLDIFYQGTAPGSATSTNCASGTVDAIESYEGTVTTSGLKYDATTGQYNYTWKTDSKWAGSCRQLAVKLKDGSVHVAIFKFTK